MPGWTAKAAMPSALHRLAASLACNTLLSLETP
jgi:hypothetical protein